ncbi:MAG: PDZ domain-containing protein [Calditrichaeota bacterium]|nr:PDZ domain-containing protein [Calditrichota bacterium]
MNRQFRWFIGMLVIGLPLWVQAQLDFQSQLYEARDKVLPALVHVEPIVSIYTSGEKQHTVVTGSGVIFSREGYVLTNHHVVENAEKVWCTLSNKERITAVVVGSDPSTDIAVLQLNLGELKDKGFQVPIATLGNSDSLQVGQIVLALGSPLGLSRSVSMGVISSIDRYFPDQGSMISPYNLWIQTDAAINPGNSGGPLINLMGEVIGINARGVFLAENLGFAIPINLAKEVANKIIAGRTVKRAWIGIEIQDVKDLREYLGKPNFRGVLLAQVDPRSPAEAAGLKPGDVIQQIGDQPVHAEFEEDLPAIRKIIADLPIGEKIPFQIWRNGKTKTIYVKTVEEPFKRGSEFEARAWGLVVKNIDRDVYRIQMLSDFYGVYVTGVKSGAAADQAHIRNGDVLRKINGELVKDVATFQELYTKLIKEKTVFVELIRNGYPYFTVIKQDNLP